jgi:hypothetical protein
MRISRRNLFKFAGASAAALLLPTTTFFLPPTCGWGAQRLKIRRVQQYLISDDTYPIRYDATWDCLGRWTRQFHVDFAPIPAEDWVLDTGILKRNDQLARQMLEKRMILDGGTPTSSAFKPS